MLIFFLYSVNAMSFNIQLEDQKHICFKENMNIDEVIYFRIRGNSSSYSFTVKFLSGNDSIVAYEHNQTYENEFQQSVYVQAQYDYCIINLSQDYISFDIDYNIGNDLVDLTKIAKKQDLEGLSQQLFEIDKKLQFFKKARGHFISKQDMMSDIQNSISKFHIAFSLGCLGLSMIITVITIQLIRRILLQKKVI